MFQRYWSESAHELKRQGFRVLAACRKSEDVARMNQAGFTGVLLDLDLPESVERAADEVIALTENRLYGIFNNAGFGVYGPLSTISREQMESSFPPTFWRTSAHHAPATRHAPARRRPHCDDLSVMGLISTPVVALMRPVSMRWKPGPMRCVWSCATAASRSA
jgi:NAD(P)-dependent dehydrogenase (short-subunit alcohol dehydrogenase family)